MKSEPQIYEEYRKYCTGIGCLPAPYEIWANQGLVLSQEEIARYEADKFLAKLHPDGSNMAGMRGYKDTHNKARGQE